MGGLFGYHLGIGVPFVFWQPLLFFRRGPSCVSVSVLFVGGCPGRGFLWLLGLGLRLEFTVRFRVKSQF